MTGVIALVRPDRIELLTDAAVTDAEGRLHSLRSKVTRLGPSAVMTGRGNLRAGEMATDAIAEVFGAPSGKSFDQAVTELEDHLSHLERDGDQSWDVTIAGWSESVGPALLWFQSTRNLGIAPWRIQRVRTGLMNAPPAAPKSWQDTMAKSGGLRDKAAFLMGGLRAAVATGPQPKGWIDRGVVIGGYVEMTVVDAKGVTTETVHRWPEDEIGERLVKRPADRTGAYLNAAAAMKMAGFEINVDALTKRDRARAKRRRT